MSDLITSLIRLADQRKLTDYESANPRGHPSFFRRPVHWVLDLDQSGNPLQLSSTTGKSVWNAEEQRFGGVGAKEMVLPNRYWLGSLNGTEPSYFLHGKLAEMFPKDQPGIAAEYKPWKMIECAKGLKCVEPVWRFLEKQRPTLKFVKDLAKGARLQDAERVTFRVAGRIVVSQSDVANWWRDYFTNTQRAAIIGELPKGTDFILGLPDAKLATKSPTIFGRTPLVSFNRAQFQSFGLGASTAGLSINVAEKVAAAVEDLNRNDASHFNYEDNRILFWATEEASGKDLDCSFAAMMARPDVLAVRDFYRSTFAPKGKKIAGQFTAVTLCNEQGRFHVRTSLTCTLKDAQEHAAQYFRAIETGASQRYLPFMRHLAECLAQPLKPNTKPEIRKKHAAERARDFARLAETAFLGQRLPDAMFAQAVVRQKIEVADLAAKTSSFPVSPENQSENSNDEQPSAPVTALGVDPERRLVSRIALLQLHFKTNKGITMNEKYDKGDTVRPEHRTAFLCGRLLAVLDHIHNEAHEGKSASSPATRLYGAASKTPALAFPQLCQLVRHHLDKLPEYKRDRFQDGVPAAKRADGVNEDFEGLTEVVAQLEATAGGAFPRMLSLEQQGVFAIGFYYQRKRCANWPHFKKNEKANIQTETSTPTA
jgi:CRISPR-associated protein Csd1